MVKCQRVARDDRATDYEQVIPEEFVNALRGVVENRADDSVLVHLVELANSAESVDVLEEWISFAKTTKRCMRQMEMGFVIERVIQIAGVLRGLMLLEEVQDGSRCNEDVFLRSQELNFESEDE